MLHLSQKVEPEGDPLFARSQQAMIQFLSTDLDLAFTLLDTARIEAADDPAHSQAALGDAQAALARVRSFEGRIRNREAWNAIGARADELEAAIKEFRS